MSILLTFNCLEKRMSRINNSSKLISCFISDGHSASHNKVFQKHLLSFFQTKHLMFWNSTTIFVMDQTRHKCVLSKFPNGFQKAEQNALFNYITEHYSFHRTKLFIVISSTFDTKSIYGPLCITRSSCMFKCWKRLKKPQHWIHFCDVT